MGRTSKGDKRPNVKPVERIHLSEENFTRKVIACVVCLVIGVVAICFAVKGLLSTDPGWITVEINSTSELNCSEDFSFRYLLGEAGVSATAEYKQIRQLYTDGVVQAYQLFSSVERFDGVQNLCYINQHPNEEILVDQALYDAFSLIREYDDRSIYLGPVYEMYQNLFYCQDDSEILYYDPYQNDEMAAFYGDVAEFARDPDSIDLQLLGDNRVRLYVSEDYLQFAEEYAFTDFLDFFWMKNAFIVDYLAGLMTENGFTNGYISSIDGYFRNLAPEELPCYFNLYDRADGATLIVGVLSELPAKSLVSLRNFPVNSQQSRFYYQLDNGQIRFPYVDITDGLCKSAVDGMVSYSSASGCAQVVLNMIPVYIGETLDPAAVNAMTAEGIYSVYVKDAVICSNDQDLQISQVYSGYTLAGIR